MKETYSDHKEFFDKCGDQWIHPTSYGECFYPVTIEEMYAHFKSRLISEVAGKSEELLYSVELFDSVETK